MDLWAWTPVCLSDVSTNATFCEGCLNWVHKRNSGISGTLRPDSTFQFQRCTGLARLVNDRQMTEVTVGKEKLGWCHSPTTLGTVSSGCGCELASITICRVTWGKFSELLSILTFCSFPITPRRRVHNSCVHATKTWTSTSSDLYRLQRNDRPMVRWMCGIITPRTK